MTDTYSKSEDQAKRYQIKDGYILREIAGEYTIIPSDPDSDISNALLLPNGSAVMLWKVFQNPSTKADAVQAAMEVYDVEEEVVSNSVQRFVDELLHYRILAEVE